MLRIRRYRPADHDEVWALHNLALNAVGAHAGNGPWDDDLHHVGKVYLQAGGEFLVGVLDRRIVAMGALKPAAPGRAGVTRMRVHPDFQRRGFGRAILRRIERRAAELGFRRLHLETTAGQLAARRLYTAAGYAEVGRTEYAGFDVLLFEKDLAGRALHARKPGDIVHAMARAKHKPMVRISSTQRAVRVPRKRIAELVEFVARVEGARVGEVDVAVVAAEEIAGMNRRYLRHAGPTDVLSFDLSRAGRGGICAQIVLCGEVAVRQAAARGLGVQREMLLYVVHGLLHLMGYEDTSIRGAAKMHAREEELLAGFLSSRRRPRRTGR